MSSLARYSPRTLLFMVFDGCVDVYRPEAIGGDLVENQPRLLAFSVLAHQLLGSQHSRCLVVDGELDIGPRVKKEKGRTRREAEGVAMRKWSRRQRLAPA
ncbi:hypothetical protein C4D60_Mb09t05540 [Musa balbisiana]|uniref:Uncharacterized protein n=1 Tax=Musa balbisiana TaxID=52838 RepID=A0A4S8IE91_MUSBA|nr:hypothetical protein C4D60_Mb09t05540 [Musa balbisiana]